MPGIGTLPASLRKHSVWFITGIAVLLVIVLVVVLARTLDQDPNVKATNRKIGAGVLVSGPEVPRTVKATVAQDVSTPFRLVTPLGPVYDLTPAGKLPEKVTVKIPLDRKVTDARALLLARADDTRRVWTVTTPTLTADGRYAEVNVTHLSLFRPLLVNVPAAAAAFKQELSKDIHSISGNPLASAQRPVCPNGAAAVTNGYSASAVGRGELFWCLGVEKGKRVLRVVNHRRFPLELEYSGLSLIHAPRSGLGLVRSANTAARGRLVIFPIAHASFGADLPVTGGWGTVNADLTGMSEGLYALEIGVTSMVNVLHRFGVMPEIVLDRKMTQGEYDLIIDYMSKFLRHEPCANAVRSHRGDTLDRIAGACMSAARAQQVFGWKSLVVAPVLTEKTPATLFHRAIRTIKAQATGTGIHRIVIHRTGPLQQLAGRWPLPERKGVLNILSNGRGTVEWSVGNCLGEPADSKTGNDCKLVGTLAFSSVPGGLVGRYTSVTYRQANGAKTPTGFTAPTGAPAVGGSTGEIKIVTKGVASNSGLGNPYLCRGDAPAAWLLKC